MPDKNKIYRWYKIKSMDETTSAEKYYMQLPENYNQKKFFKYNIKKFEEKIKFIKKELIKKKYLSYSIRMEKYRKFY